uniref:VWFA domain-containing protein n=1 Tax=Angiostrongylus cantonensis TaxID=6313 RepID=A0A0K0DLQ2_ANGCA
MIGPGSLEEAMESAKDYATNRPKSNIEPLCAGEENNSAPLENDDNAEEEYQVSIYLASEQMFNLVEDFTKELTISLTGVDKATGDTRCGDSKDLSEAKNEWAQMSRTVEILAAELAENLRLILEPQRVSKMQYVLCILVISGDYRTGKRLNMRRLIPYIASEYRKDRIWMRRTKKAQREYQVLIAVDDSASMNENGIHQLFMRQVTYESVCIIEDALRRCDAGAVSVCSFGSDVKIINAFSDYMMYGPEFLQKLTFNQSSTDLLLLLNSSRQMLCDVRTQTSEQLLIIISDGRGALAHGVNKILRPYLETFPFPFYVVVKAITQLPSVLAESIRQWFEMTVQNISV